MYWTPDTWFAGQTVYVVGGGPSLLGYDFGRLDGRRVIAVNASGYDLPGADVLFFSDNSWCEANRGLLASWRGAIVTTNSQSAKFGLGRFHLVETDDGGGFRVGRGPIRSGRSSGQTAVSLSIAMGAKRVVLLGFDMKGHGGAAHYHSGRPLYTSDQEARSIADLAGIFLPAWKGWRSDALLVGCEIINATPGSAIAEFPIAQVNEILG